MCCTNWVLIIQDKWSLQSVYLLIISITFRRNLFFYLVGREVSIEAYKYQNARHHFLEDSSFQDG
jgi:hypothetical protein